MKRQFLGLLARVYVMQFAMEVPATVAMLAEMLMEYGFQVDIGSVRPLLRALQMEGYLESVLRDGIGRVSDARLAPFIEPVAVLELAHGNRHNLFLRAGP